MKIETLKIVEQVLKTDPTVDSAARSRVLKAARQDAGAAPEPANGNEQPRIYSRDQAAKLLGDKTPRYVDLLCKKGLLQRFIPKGNTRGIGVTSTSLNNFLSA